MLPPDGLTLFERADTSHGLPVYHLIGRFDHGIHEHEEDLATFHESTMSWRLHESLKGIINYKLVVDRINAMPRHFEALCYNCHGLKEVRVKWGNRKTGFSGYKSKACPVCKGKGVKVRGTAQQELFI